MQIFSTHNIVPIQYFVIINSVYINKQKICFASCEGFIIIFCDIKNLLRLYFGFRNLIQWTSVKMGTVRYVNCLNPLCNIMNNGFIVNRIKGLKKMCKVRVILKRG